MIHDSDGTRRTIDELITLHEVEAGLHEIYVEGRTDAGLIEWFLRRQQTAAAVFAVSDRVEVDFDVCQYGVEFGEKGKVVAVARRLSEKGADKTFTCIADADYWHSLESPPAAAESVLLTDYTDVNMYCFNEHVIGKFLLVCLRAPHELKPRMVLSTITPLLQALFVLRWLMRRELPDLKLVSRVDRRIALSGGTVALNVAKLLEDSISASNDPQARQISKEAVLAAHQRIVERIADDPRKWVNGHDFVRFLCFYLEKFHSELLKDDRKDMRNPVTAKLTLLGCLDAHDLAAEGLFRRLLLRLAGTEEPHDYRPRPRTSVEALAPHD
ncbi:hypothetical protein [Micromonospora sp. NPDC003776]